MNRFQAGFTLIELLIVMSIIGILMGIAYPNYQAHLVKTRRADAQAALTGFANAMERYYTQNNSYVGAGTVDDADGVNNVGAPTIYPTQSPIDGNAKHYNLRIMAATMTTYTLRATPISPGQVSDGYLELLSTGARRWDKNNINGIEAGENSWD